MIPTNGSSFGRAGGRLRRYPGGTENASIFATVRGSIPNRRAASRRLSPSTYTARRTCPYSSAPFIPPPSAHLGRRFTAAGLSLRRVLYPAASVMDFLSGALTRGSLFGFWVIVALLKSWRAGIRTVGDIRTHVEGSAVAHVQNDLSKGAW